MPTFAQLTPANWQQSRTIPSGGGYQAPTFNYSAAPVATPGASTDINQLTEQINALNRSGQTQANAARIPGATQLEQTSSENINRMLHGELPQDVVSMLAQSSAERGVATGSPGSPNANAAYLRALGLTSLQEQQQGEQNLSAAYQRNPAAPLFDPTSQLLTPYQSGQLGLQEGQLGLQAQAEADRVALEQQRLAQEADLASAAASRGTGNRSGLSYAPSPAPATGSQTLTGSDIFGSPDFSTQDWWNSIGFTPGQGVLPGSGSTTISGDLGTTQDSSSAPLYDWGSLFSPDLGFDPSLYSGGE